MLIPSTEEQYNEIFQTRPAESSSVNFITFTSQLSAKKIAPEPFIFFCYFWRQFASFFDFTEERPLVHQINSACNKFKTSCMNKDAYLHKLLERLLSETIINIGRYGYISEFKNYLKEAKTSMSLESRAIPSEAIETIEKISITKFHRCILEFWETHKKLETTYFALITVEKSLGAIAKKNPQQWRF